MLPVRTVFFCLVCLSLLAASCRQKETTVFTSLPASATGIHFTNKLEKHRLFNILYYLYYYNGGGVATGDINNDGLTDIYFTANNKGGNKLFLNKGNFRFEDITEKAGVAGTSDWCTGVTMADVNADGLLDIYVSSVSNRYGLKGHNELFINSPGGRFTESSKEYGLDVSCFTTQSAFFDYDHDGDLDCYILNQSHNPHSNIVDTSRRNRYDSLAGDRLYRNDMNTAAKKFTDVSKEAGIYQSNLGYGLGLAIADLNNDGWDDVYVGNDFHENDYYYINNGNGSFTENGASHFGHYSRFSMGNDAADYNNDGQIDLVTVDMLPPDEKTLKTYGSDENPDTYKMKLTRNGYQDQYSRNCLQQNNGNGSSFTDIALLSGVEATDWSWSALFADLDNDGNKDLFITSGIVKRPVDLDYIRYASDLKFKGMDRTDKYDDDAIAAMPDGSSHPYIFNGNGRGGFKDVSKEWGTEALSGYFNGAAYADLDNDGDLDLVINCIDQPAVILQNNSPKKSSLSITFKGEGANTTGIGAKAYLFSQGKTQYQQLMPTRGFESSCDTRLHFGLDSLQVIDSLLIVWPDQSFELLKNVQANRPLTVSQKNSGGRFDATAWFAKPAEAFKVLEGADAPSQWRHRENEFYDYNIQYLIPHAESTRGPRIATADVNGDGLDDFYVCGALGQPGALMIQQPDGKFQPSDTALFNQDAFCEDVDAVFFDANGDTKPDLYVVSGGNEYNGQNDFLLDRLYLNDGTGRLSKTAGALPPMYDNKSTVAVADVDKDGDIDLFVGVLADPHAYGIAQHSYLLINNGKGVFTPANKNTIDLNKLGMVSTSAFADLDNDGYPELIVAGEWMPVTVFKNNKDRFEKSAIPNSSGLWQTLYIRDADGDGKADILAGNWGLNSKLKASTDSPLKLYIKDFDKNGSIEQIMAYTKNGEEYPFLAKDELERRLPVLKKAYLKYSEVAGKTVQYMMYDLLKDNTELKVDELASCFYINDGKGSFLRQVLPDNLQHAPIFSFQQGGSDQQFFAGGNFFDVIPYEGGYDGQSLALFDVRNKNVNRQWQPSLSATKGQVRDIKRLRTINSGDIWVVARNNATLLFLKKN